MLAEALFVDEILEEPLGAAHRDPKSMAEVVRNAIIKNLDDLCSLDSDQLIDDRQRRLAGFGQFKEA